MFKQADKELIEEMGWQDLPQELQAEQLNTFYATLQIKIGLALEHALSDKQLLEFEKVNAKGDDAATTAWLQQAIPNYDQIANKELSVLKQDLKRTSAQFKKAIETAAD